MSLRFVPPHLYLSNTHPSPSFLPSFLQNYPFLENEARFVPRSRDTKYLEVETPSPFETLPPDRSGTTCPTLTYSGTTCSTLTYLGTHCLGLREVCVCQAK